VRKSICECGHSRWAHKDAFGGNPWWCLVLDCLCGDYERFEPRKTTAIGFMGPEDESDDEDEE
jgi:hypothetical protein